MKPIEKQKQIITVRGIVAPSEWGADDEVTAITLYAHNEEEYLVSEKQMVKRLLKHFDEEVEATGFISEDEYGEEVFIVSDFQPVTSDDDEDDDWDDDDFDEDDDDEDEDDDWDDDWDDDEDEDEEEEDGRGWKRYEDR
jgi:hypothetical protein